jgi:diguanylate cyclase (GGDEF)-like protein
MSLDLPTSLAIAGFTLSVAGGLLLLSWLHNRSHQALAQWGLAFFLAAVAIALIAARGHIPDVWSILVANTSLAAAYGVMWKGVRTFEGRPSRAAFVFGGALVWLLACTIPAFYAVPTARAILLMAIGMTYSLLAVGELWRGRGEPLISRWPIMIVLTVHAITLPLRVPLASSLSGAGPAQLHLLAFVMFESLLFCMCAAYLLGSLSKERVALRHKQSSLLDPLTAVPNRRAFLNQAARIIDRSGVSRQPVALLLFDLDRFKSVNDQYGHAAGDEALVAFCRVATSQLRPTDLFARLGGEEFGCLLPDTSRADALAIAERIRVAFETTSHAAEEAPFVVTVSIGMAVVDSSSIDLPSLLVTADRALYRAKQAGRNRVEPASLDTPRTLAQRRVSESNDGREKQFDYG